ncbi:MAG: ABC transporter substrate-binding protein [Anaerolineae bacterium]|nr:ABC transporter substrate-binding protein [Anaerolineae bacterium]
MLKNKRWLLLANVVIVLMLVATACGTPAPPPPAETPAPGETPAPTTPPAEETPAPPPPTEIKNPDSLIDCNIGGEPDSLDPAYQYDTASYEIIFNVYEGLLFYNRESYTEFVPVLATDMPEASDDLLTYTFNLREGIKFHEGGDLTPEDVAYTLWRGMLQDRSGGPQWVILEPLTGRLAINDIADEMGDQAACEYIKSTVVPDNDNGTVTFHLPKPFGAFLNIIASGWGVVLDKEWVIEQGGWDGDCATWRDFNDPEDIESELYSAMNGTGPYKFDHWTPGEEMVLVRNDDYWLTEPLWEGGPTGPAAIERAVWKYMTEWGTRLAAFEALDCDMVDVPRQYATQADELVQEQWDAGDMSDPSKMTILNENGIARSFINMPSVSSADIFLNQKVNVEGGNPYIGSGALDGDGIPPDFFSDIHVRKAFNYCFDWDTYIEEAYLGEAIQRRGPIIEGHIGYTPDSEVFSFDMAKCEEEFKLAWDGAVWETGFYVIIQYNSGNDQRRTAAEILEANIESLNEGKFSVSVLDVPWATYLDEMTASRLPVFLIGWVEDYHHPHNWVLPYTSANGTWSMFQGWPQEQYDKYDAKIQECLAIPFADAAPCYEELQAMAIEDVIDVFGIQATTRHYEQLWVKGFYENPIYPSCMWAYRFSKEM